MLRTDGKSFRPIHPLPILTDTDSNRFLGLLTIPIPIPIFIYEYHTDTDFAKNTDIPIPIPIIPIIGLSLAALKTFVVVGWWWLCAATIGKMGTKSK